MTGKTRKPLYPTDPRHTPTLPGWPHGARHYSHLLVPPRENGRRLSLWGRRRETWGTKTVGEPRGHLPFPEGVYSGTQWTCVVTHPLPQHETDRDSGENLSPVTLAHTTTFEGHGRLLTLRHRPSSPWDLGGPLKTSPPRVDPQLLIPREPPTRPTRDNVLVVSVTRTLELLHTTPSNPAPAPVPVHSASPTTSLSPRQSWTRPSLEGPRRSTGARSP